MTKRPQLQPVAESVHFLDDYSGHTLARDLRWLWHNAVPQRRKRQGLLVLGLMLLGGFSELVTLGAVVPLLAVFASSGSPQSSNKITDLMSRFGIDLAQYSLTTIALIFCCIAVCTAIIRILLSWSGQRYIFGIRHDVGVALYNRLLRQPYTFHVGVNSSRILASLGNVSSLAGSLLMPMLQSVIALIIGSFVIAGLILLSPFASLVAISGFALIYGGLSMTTGKKLRRNGEIIGMMNRERFQTVQEGLGGIGDVLLSSSQAIYVHKFSTIDRRTSRAASASALLAVTPRYVAEATGIILMVTLALILYQQKGGAAASLPVLGALALGAQRLLPLMQQTYFGWTSVIGSRWMLFELVNLLRQPIPPCGLQEPLPRLHSSIRLDAVDFHYSTDDSPTLRHVSLEIPKGSRVGFVGKSGSGKTTLLNLVMGLLEPQSGAVLIDGERLTPRNKQSWQQQVARVPQSIFLIDGSIAENIAFGVNGDDIDWDKLRHVCQQAELAEFVDSLPGGYSTFVGERGVRLSGGQIQRIGLARALYKDATVLVLDEATSALDDATEANVIDAVRRLGREYTVLMIAHRTTTLRECDVVFKLAGGALVASGTPEEILGAAPTTKGRPPSTISSSRKVVGHEQ